MHRWELDAALNVLTMCNCHLPQSDPLRNQVRLLNFTLFWPLLLAICGLLSLIEKTDSFLLLDLSNGTCRSCKSDKLCRSMGIY